MKKIIILIVVIIAIIIFWSYGRNATPTTPETTTVTPTPITTDTGSSTAEGTITTAPATVTTGAVKEFTVIGSNYSFTPNTLEVKKGDTVKITFKNANGTHDFKLDEFQVTTKRIKSGESETVQFVADKTGSFEYYCSVGTHRAMGMKGTRTLKI